MNSKEILLHQLRTAAGAGLVTVAMWLCAVNAQAALTHRYSFDNGVTDSIAGANGTTQGDVTVSSGSANFPGGSNADYIELPSGLISNYTSVTFEFWATVADNGTWEELYAFGNQTAGGEGANMVMFTPHSGANPPDFRMSYAQAAPGYNDEKVVNGVGILDNAGPTSVACVYDVPNNSMALYTNGALVRILSPVTTGTKRFSLTNVINKFSWLGRSLYNADAPYNGTIEEFRIYDAPLSPLQVYVNNAAGANTVVTNIEISSLTWNAEKSMVVGSRQNTTVTFNTAKYGSVTLAGATEATYSSADSQIIRVTPQGQLFALKEGSTTVSAVYNGTTNNTVITVTAPKLVHRYSFTADASDSVGGANGTLMGGATISNGAVVLPGGTTSGDPAAPYVDLPNNLVTNLTASTFEAWATDNESAAWARIWDFGNSAGGEGVSDTGSAYVMASLPNGSGAIQGTIHLNDRGDDASVTGTRPASGQLFHLVWASDIASRTSWLYLNGLLLGANANTTVGPADLGKTVNNWLGRSQFSGDAAFSGTITEFRIYDGAVSPLQVALNAASGPDTILADPGAVQSLQLSIGTNVLTSGGFPVQATLTANFANVTNVNLTSVPGVTYTSSDPGVLTVTGTGQLRDMAAGSATVTASYGGKSTTLPVTVGSLPGHTAATLTHRYSFSETSGTTVKDSVGTADGTVKGLGATFANGQISLPGGTGSGADAATLSGYVDLPNHIINVSSDLSVEAWVTWEGSSQWQRIFDLGTSATGEDVSDGSGNYLFLSPQGSANHYQFSVRDPNAGNEPSPLIAATALPTNEEVYLAVAYDFANNIARLYSNAVLVAWNTAPIDLMAIDDVNNWLGRSQWNDPMFQGKYNEFRLWKGVLLPGEIATHYAAGPDSLDALPKVTASVSGGNLSISWSASASGFVLQSSPKLGQGATWTPVTTAPTSANGTSTVTVPTSSGTLFYRLAK